jgi:hypothetical protein
VDIDKMERLLEMQERIMAKQAETAFNIALNEVQADMKRIAADANNKQTSSKYASYAALDRVLRPVYTERGLSLSFDTGDGAAEGYVRVLCYVSHSMGHTRTYRVDMACDGKGAKGGDVMTKTHAMGSAFTYGQRYLLKAIFNVAVGDDDDGNGASQPDAVSKTEIEGVQARWKKGNPKGTRADYEKWVDATCGLLKPFDSRAWRVADLNRCNARLDETERASE